jgi:hypothetical protein
VALVAKGGTSISEDRPEDSLYIYQVFLLFSVQQSMHTDIVLPLIFATNGKVIYLGDNL